MLARADIAEEHRVPCHFYIDEFHNYVSDTLKETFSEGRKYKVYLTVATQTVGQEMSAAMQKHIMGNVNVKIIGKSGYESRDMMMKQMGFNTAEEKAASLVYYRSLWKRLWYRKPVTVRDFKKLQVGTFICQVDIANPHHLTNRQKLLGDAHSMSKQQRERIKQQQLHRYYCKPFYYKPKAIPHQST